MRIAFVQTYPVYHDGVGTDEWRSLNSREIDMAACLARSGHAVEYWAVGRREESAGLPGKGEELFPLRVFPPRRFGGLTRNHWSPGLLARAREFRADLHILNGLDGGAGTRLLRFYVLPAGAAFGFILGGGHYSRFVPRARCVFYQSEDQRVWLEEPGARLWRRAVRPERLIFLPRTVDTELFSPDTAAVKEWDVLVACRLVDRLKNLGVLGPLGRSFRVAVAGSGPDEARLRKRFPHVAWLGRIPHEELPRLFRASRVFMHTGRREILPRVITEALSCGVPVVAFAGPITPEAVPPGCGLLLPKRGYIGPIGDLLANEAARRTMGAAARAHAVARLSPAAVEGPVEEMMRRLD